MASNLDYLDPALIPLEEKVGAYLTVEKALRRATDAGKTEVLTTGAQDRSEASFGQAPEATAGIAVGEPQSSSHKDLRAELDGLAQEIIALLPTRDEWVKVNLGYGPSRVGAWQVPGSPGRYELRVVH